MELAAGGCVGHNVDMKQFMFVLSVAAGFALAIVQAHAATPCTFNAESVALKKAQAEGGTLTLNDELTLRKNFLKKVVDCAVDETGQLKDKLRKSSTPDKDIERIKAQLDDQLSQAIGYYNLRQSEIGDLGLYGAASMAQAIHDWRKNVYLPLNQKISNLFLWVSNQAVFERADARFRQVSQLVKDNGLLSLVSVQNIFDQAQISFHKAQVANDDAKRSLGTSVSADDSLSLITSSLSALADTYAQFFDLSKAVSSR